MYLKDIILKLIKINGKDLIRLNFFIVLKLYDIKKEVELFLIYCILLDFEIICELFIYFCELLFN